MRILDAGLVDAPIAFAGHARDAGSKAQAFTVLAHASTAAVRLAATSDEALIAACQEGSDVACDELGRRGIEPPMLEIDNEACRS